MPVARSTDGLWIAINWFFRENRPGWIAASRVSWDPNLDLMTLPLLVAPYLITPPPDITTPESLSPTPPPPSATTGATVTNTVVPSSTPEPIIGNDAATMAVSSDVVAQPPDNVVASPATSSGGSRSYGLIVIIIAITLAATMYAGWVIRGLIDKNRFSEGFHDGICPICGKGDLTLEETQRSTLGIIQMKRTVRCSECHSIIRQVRPRVWRYSVDPFMNESLAKKISSDLISDDDLQGIFNDAALRRKSRPEEAGDTDALQKAQEIVAELEARFMEEKQREKKLVKHEKETGSSGEPAGDQTGDPGC